MPEPSGEAEDMDAVHVPVHGQWWRLESVVGMRAKSQHMANHAVESVKRGGCMQSASWEGWRQPRLHPNFTPIVSK